MQAIFFLARVATIKYFLWPIYKTRTNGKTCLDLKRLRDSKRFLWTIIEWRATQENPHFDRRRDKIWQVLLKIFKEVYKIRKKPRFFKTNRDRIRPHAYSFYTCNNIRSSLNYLQVFVKTMQLLSGFSSWNSLIIWTKFGSLTWERKMFSFYVPVGIFVKSFSAGSIPHLSRNEDVSLVQFGHRCHFRLRLPKERIRQRRLFQFHNRIVQRGLRKGEASLSLAWILNRDLAQTAQYF